MLHVILSLLAFAPVARAADFCAGLQTLHSHVFFCEDNVTYAKYAEKCKEQFKALAQAKSLALQKVLTGGIAGAVGESQTTHFKTTQASYDAADLALAEAIDTGRHARAEVVGYGDDFVAPFAWPWMDLGPWPGLHHRSVQELFRSQGCYKDNIQSIEHTTAEFDQMIRDLKSARATTAQLHKRANGRELSLADLSSIPVIGAQGVAGQSRNGVSDVTGTARDKTPSLSSAVTSAKWRDPNLDPQAAAGGAAKNSSSDITKSTEPTRLFATNLDPARISAGAKGGAEPESVGSALWSAAGLVVSGSKPHLSLAPAPGGIPGNASASEDASREPASVSAPALSSTVSFAAGPDRDLFALVHARYRASELFLAPRTPKD